MRKRWCVKNFLAESHASASLKDLQWQGFYRRTMTLELYHLSQTSGSFRYWTAHGTIPMLPALQGYLQMFLKIFSRFVVVVILIWRQGCHEITDAASHLLMPLVLKSSKIVPGDFTSDTTTTSGAIADSILPRWATFQIWTQWNVAHTPKWLRRNDIWEGNIITAKCWRIYHGQNNFP